jgi:hypothetical protein
MLILLGVILVVPGFVFSQGLKSISGKTIQSGVRQGKAYMLEDSSVSIQAMRVDKPGAVLMGTSLFVHFVNDDVWEMQHIIPVNQSDLVEIDVDFAGVFNSNIKFHVIFSGPEYYVYDDEDWYLAKYSTANYLEQNVFYITIDPSEWKKGTYKLVVIAEQETEGSGAESVIECVFRLI